MKNDPDFDRERKRLGEERMNRWFVLLVFSAIGLCFSLYFILYFLIPFLLGG